MQCFVITPFANAFDDVYTTVKLHVEAAGSDLGVTCCRLDESRPAGRITDRLRDTLRESAFCIADLTGCNPNVMWETGYAMALGKPVILITQDLATLPFDIRDMEALGYDRSHLHSSLGMPLRDIVRDTIELAVTLPGATNTESEEHATAVVGLGVQLAEIKEMVGQMVAAWNTSQRHVAPTRTRPELADLEGAWLNEDSHSSIYIAIINNVVVAPYCYGGHSDLTAYYYDWQMVGDYMFARFKWLVTEIRGFTFLKRVSRDMLQGSWWYDDAGASILRLPAVGSGNPVTWSRMTTSNTPAWASDFFSQVRKGHVPDFLGVPDVSS